MQKINKKLLRKLPKSKLELLALQACLDEVDKMIFDLTIKGKTLDNISVNSGSLLGEWKSRDTIHRILKEIYVRAQGFIKTSPEFRELLETP